jgi:hypothetical protein
MSKAANIALHLQVIAKARQLPVASDKRMALINRSIQGILRAMLPSYNESHI